MANPRKFSDKIALHTQKQAEDTAAFEAIIREVSATTKVSAQKPTNQQIQQQQQQQPAQQQHHLQLIQPNFGGCRGHSLPNVNQVANNSIDLQSALSSLEDMRQAVSGHSIPDKQHRDRGQQPQKKFSVDRHRDCSPYGSVSYLSPPPDTSWRRASSDSALHSTVQGGTANLSGSGIVMTNGQVDGNLLQVSHMTGMEGCQMWDPRTLRPRSCEVPGISIYPSPDPSSTAASILISNNTGSLPDLANLNFPSSLMSPIDADVSSSQQCSSQDSGILENYMSPVSLALQFYQQQMPKQQPQTQSLPMASTGIQRHMVPAPLILQGSNNFLMGGGNTVLAQDNIYSLVSNKAIPDTRSPPTYSSFAPPKSSPLSPPLITLTDVTQNGHMEKILFSEFEPENGWHQTNGWSNFPSKQPNQLQRQFEKSIRYSEKPKDFAAKSLSSKDSAVCFKHRHASPKSRDNQRNSCFSSCVNNKELAVDDIEMKNEDILAKSAIIKSEDIKLEEEGLTMAQYRGGSSDGPQSPVSPLSQPSSSYSPSQSPGTSASMASSPQLADAGYQQELVSTQLPYSGATSQLVQSSGNLTQQQLTRLVGKPVLPAESLQQKFQQIKVADSGSVGSELNLCTTVQQQLQQQKLQQHLQQQLQHQQLLQQQQLHQQQQMLSQQQQQQQAAAAAALMSSGNVVFMQTVFDHPPILVSSITPNSFYQQVSTQSTASQQQLHQPMQQQVFQNPYAATNQGHVAASDQPQPLHYLPNVQQPSAANTIPDIILTAADLSLYANQAIMDIKNTGGDPAMTASQNDLLSRDNVNLLSYLGDSFDADMLTTDDFLKIGLDPLELEEIRMLSDGNIVTDPATEDSFRLDRI